MWLGLRGVRDVVLFFFFRQNTAYGLRMSDWSSDVCSSVLVARDSTQGRQHHSAATRAEAPKSRCSSEEEGFVQAPGFTPPRATAPPAPALPRSPPSPTACGRFPRGEIGRAHV